MSRSSYPVLYVIIRDDIPSMTAGKAEAHSGHACSLLWHSISSLKDDSYSPPVKDYFKQWLGSGSGFGTQINLQGGLEEGLAVQRLLPMSQSYLHGKVVDPTYPWLCPLTGEFCTREEITGFWFFGMNNAPEFVRTLGKLKLKK